MNEPVNVVLSLDINLIGLIGALVILIAASAVAVLLGYLEERERKP